MVACFMFDTHAIARQLTGAGLTPDQADAITDAVRQAAEHGGHVTPETLRGGLAELRSDLYRAMLIQAGGIVGAIVGIVGLVLTAVRLVGST